MALTHALNLNRHWSIVWSICCMLGQLSIRRHFSSSTFRTGCWY